MLKILQDISGSNVQILKAGENLKRGAVVQIEHGANKSVKGGAADEVYLVDVPKNYDGINSIIEPTETAFEEIKSGDKVLVIAALTGTRYATTEVTATGLTVGDKLCASAGKFVKADTGKDYSFIYDGVYDNPYGLNMYIVERVRTETV